MNRIWLIGLLMAVIVFRSSAASDFDRDVAPILESKCLSCHNPNEAKGDVVLANRGETAEHLKKIVALVSGPDPDMPKKGKALTEEQVKTLEEWIEAGAVWPEGRTLVENFERDLEWWSLRPVVGGQTAEVRGSSTNPVDGFVAAKLKEKGLTPVGQADALTLIRRVTYDLTGLPPTPGEIDGFIAAWESDAAKAWEKLVDRLLASPAFGEKFARHWLDVARYAETHGYDKDKPRMNAWPYRDYVIRSFNEDKAYGRFVQEQVAGDALFAGDADGVLGLGFLSAGPWDFIGHQEVGEGKLDGRIAKHLDRDEMVSAVFNVFQSTTVQCAQCHHHKFDPIQMEDYYRLHAVFAAVDRADRVYAGLPTEQQKEKLAVQSRINALQAEQRALDTEIKRLLDGKVSGLDRRIAELKEKYGSGLKPQYGYHSQIVKNPDEEKWVQIDLGRARGIEEIRIIPAYDNYAGIGGGFGFPVRYRVEAAEDAEFSRGVRLLFDATAKDQPNPRTRTVRVDGDGRPIRFLRVTATKLRERRDDYIFALGEIELVNEGGAQNYAKGRAVSAKDSIEASPRWGKANLVDGIFYRELGNEAALAELRDLQDKRAAIEKEIRPAESVARLAAIKEELAPLTKKLSAFPRGELVYAATANFTRAGNFRATEGKPREIRLLHRGDLRTPGDPMKPGAPPLWHGVADEFSLADSSDETEARAALARYLVRKDNPLVWRSIANRLWQWTMGSPLVATPNDFGRGGMQPSHPELLDYLASRLRDDPRQSMKSIVRLLVTSETYRRGSVHDPDNARIDSGNNYLWRAHRRRLTAEEFRDSLLAVSGVLDRKMGGPSFQDFVIEKPQHSPHYEYHLHDPNDPKSHRRSIYRFVVRSQPQPMLTTLDCADPSMSVAERDESTTALQALTQWNARLVEAMSRKFAERLAAQKFASPDEMIDYACRVALGRRPDAQEKSVMREHLQAHGEENFARLLFNLNAFVYVD
jgi:mono/diheme cytochrome c family protein